MTIAKMVSEKVSGYQNDGFSETLDYKILQCTNVEGNNNKFYCAEIQKNPSGDLRIFTHYGRLGRNDVYEVRDKYKTGASLRDYDQVKKEFDSLIRKKEKGKNVKRGGETIREQYFLHDSVSSSIGSENIRNQDSQVQVKPTAVKAKSKKRSPEVDRLLRMVEDENIHNITSSTTIKFTSRGFELPLGMVTEGHLDRAQGILLLISSELNGYDTNSLVIPRRLVTLNNEYLSLIPREVGASISKSDMVLNSDKVDAELDIIEQLRTSLKLGITADDSASDKLEINISLLSNKGKIFKEIYEAVESTKHKDHVSRLGNWHVDKVYKVDIPKSTRPFNDNGKPLGNIVELFHGTRNANVLSLMLNGFIIPPSTAGHTTGRMFGDGVYGASCSTKALNYATGYWGSGNKNNNAMMFIADFAMGNTYFPDQSLRHGPPDGYDSVHAKSGGVQGWGGSLVNDEFIVYKTNQTKIRYLLELTKS